MYAAEHEMREMKIKELVLLLEMNNNINFIGLRYKFISFDEYVRRDKQSMETFKNKVKEI